MGKLLGVGFVVGKNRWQTVAKIMVALVSIVIVTASWGRIDQAHAAFWERSRPTDTQTTIKATGKISEASPPIALQALRQALDDYQPQVTILSPRKNDVLSDNTVSVRFLVKDLPLFKNETFGLGPHLHVLLDNRSYQAVYDPNQPLVFDNLEPGTHTIRAFASRPWHESFKNEGAFAQTTFHVLTKTQDNQPNPDLPLLTYSRPQGIYGAEPILLDFYLTNAPLHLIAQADQTDDIADWRIRCTVNGDSFVIDRWQPLYLKGFKPGKNWVQLEYLDDKGNPVQNVFNNTVRLVEYQPNGDDTLSKLVRGDLSAADVRGIVDPNYVPPAPEPSPEAAPSEPVDEPAPVPSPTLPNPPLAPTPEPTSELDASDRTSPLVPPPLTSPTPPPASSPEAAPDFSRPESTTSRSETVSPPEAAVKPDENSLPESPTPEPAIKPDENSLPESPAVVETKPAPPDIQPVSPDAATPTDPKTLSGRERLRQLGRQLGQYLPQRRAIAPSSDGVRTGNSKRKDSGAQTNSGAQIDNLPTRAPVIEPNFLPGASIPASLPPTLPEMISPVPSDSPTGETTPSSLEEPSDR